MTRARSMGLGLAVAVFFVGTAAAPARAAPLRWAYVQVEGGVQSLDLRAFDAGDEDHITAGFVPIQSVGPSFALSAGGRLFFLQLGARLSMSHFDDDTERTVGAYDLWTVGAEIGTRLTLGPVEPYVLFGVGYAAFGGLDDAISGLSRGLDVDGVDLRAAVGADVFVTRVLSMGARLGGDVLLLSRPGAPIRELGEPQYVETLGEARQRVLEADGASAGGAWSLTAVLGLTL